MKRFFARAKREMPCVEGDIKKHEILCLKYAHTITLWDYYKEVGGLGRWTSVRKDTPLSYYFDIIEND